VFDDTCGNLIQIAAERDRNGRRIGAAALRRVVSKQLLSDAGGRLSRLHLL
jgi:hypothetical protein